MALDLSRLVHNPLSESRIKKMRENIRNCPNPYTEEEMNALPFDGVIDSARARAYMAIKILTEHGIPLTDEDDTTE